MITFEGEYSEIPLLTQEGIKRYVEHKVAPGSFLTAVLCNDLKAAVGRADPNNLKSLRLIVNWFYNNYPELYGRENFVSHLNQDSE